MQQVVFLLLIGLVLIQADSLLEMDAHCAEECGSPEYDELVKELDHQDEVLNDLVTRAVNVEHSLDQSKKEHDDADRESRNLLLRLDRLHSDKEHDVCPKKHRKCLTSAARDGKPCVANILVCDGEEDCLDGSDEDPELCKYPVLEGQVWHGGFLYYNCVSSSWGPQLNSPKMTVNKIRHFDHFKSVLLIEGRLFWTSKANELESYPLSMVYSYGDRIGRAHGNIEGVAFRAEYVFEGDAITVTTYLTSMRQVCASRVMVPHIK